jgi:protein gp37
MTGNKTKIRWTQATWNPVVGCNHVSPGCDHCYAEALTKRFPKNFPNGFELTMHPERLDLPLYWKEPRRVFVNSMSDLFHERLPFEFIDQVFDVMEKCPQHTFQILTKRPGIMYTYIIARYLWEGDPKQQILRKAPKHIWLGTSVEDALRKPRIDVLRRIPAHVRFLSLEPLLGDLGILDLSGISWVIVGGESGPRYRPMSYDWARHIRDQCLDQKVAFFYKQDSGPRTEMNPILDGVRWEQYPE